MSGVIAFTKSGLPGGWMGNMSSHRMLFGGREWRSCEAVFQATRFTRPLGPFDPDVKLGVESPQEEVVLAIWREKSPMGAKIVAKKHRDLMLVKRYSPSDLTNMATVLWLKVKQHPELKTLLLETGTARLIEDVSKRMGGSGLFWGAANLEWGWVGENHLGRLWMDLRTGLLIDG